MWVLSLLGVLDTVVAVVNCCLLFIRHDFGNLGA